MWQVSLGQFLHQPAQQARLDALPSMPLPVPRVLLYGPHRTCVAPPPLLLLPRTPRVLCCANRCHHPPRHPPHAAARRR